MDGCKRVLIIQRIEHCPFCLGGLLQIGGEYSPETRHEPLLGGVKSLWMVRGKPASSHQSSHQLKTFPAMSSAP